MRVRRPSRLVEQLLDALVQLRTTTRAAESDVRRALKLALNGSDIATAVVACNPAGTRQAMNDALDAVESARHDMRLRIFRVGLDEGMTIGELGQGVRILSAAGVTHRQRGTGGRLTAGTLRRR